MNLAGEVEPKCPVVERSNSSPALQDEISIAIKPVVAGSMPQKPPSRLVSPPLTLKRIMASIGALGLAFAFLSGILSASMAAVVLGILVLEGLRVPLVTEKRGKWKWLAWVIWSVALATAPIATGVVGALYEHTGPLGFTASRPWAADLVDALGMVHLGVSVVAAILVVVLTQGRYRWLAWAVILAVGVLDAIIALGTAMKTTGLYL